MSFFGNRKNVDVPPTPAPSAERKPAIGVSAQQPVGFETVLGATSVFEGGLRSGANVRLDGTFSGTLEITGNVLIGETARITADVNARNISIAGAVRGNVHGKKVQILRTGRVWGDIHAEALTTEEGAFIDGKITMTRPDVAAEAAFAPVGQPVEPAAQPEQAQPEQAQPELAQPEPDEAPTAEAVLNPGSDLFEPADAQAEPGESQAAPASPTDDPSTPTGLD